MTSHRSLRLLVAAALLGVLGAGAMIFLYAPPDALQGEVQRIFYVHVASAVAAYAGFALVVTGGLAYLWRESAAGDRLARAAAPVGLLMTTVTLIMGSLWAKPVWGAYWIWWDARLMSTLALWLIYAGYLLVRRVSSPGRQSARLAAVAGIVGFIDVPVVHFSVVWWRTNHPQAVVSTAAGPQLPPEMLLTFGITLVAISFLTLVLVLVRYRLEALADALATRRGSEVAEEPEAAVPATHRWAR
jgi:heme exporter protein C